MQIWIWFILVIIAAFANAVTLEYREGFFTWLVKQFFSTIWITILVAVVGWAIERIFGGS